MTMNVIHYINDQIFKTQKNKQKYIDIYLNTTYRTELWLYSLSMSLQLLDTIYSSHHEMNVRFSYVKKSKELSRFVINSLFYSPNFLCHLSMCDTGIMSYFAVHTRNFCENIDNLKKKKRLAQGIKDVLHEQGLKNHKIRDNAFIYTDPYNDKEPAFMPQTIINIHGHKVGDKLYFALQKQMETILNMSNHERAENMNNMIETCIINEKDCKKEKISTALLGQKGVYAKTHIKKHTVIGFYTGIYLKDEAAQEKLFKELGAHQSSLYMFSFSKSKFPRVSAYQYGNQICLINASITYEKNLAEIAKQYHLHNNLCVVYAKSGENPDKDYQADIKAYDLITYVTTRDIKKGEQLFVDYGISYWQNRIKTTIDATQQDVVDAIKKYEIELKDKNAKKYSFK